MSGNEWSVDGSVSLMGAGSVLAFFGAELVHWRRLRGVTQQMLADRVLYSRTLVGGIETGRRWPPQDFAVRCDEILQTGGALARLWALVDQHRRAARLAVGEVNAAHIQELVLRLALITGTDVTALDALRANRRGPRGEGL